MINAARLRLAVAVTVNLAVLLWPETPGTAGVPGLDKAVHALVFGTVAWTGRHAGLPVLPLLGTLVAWAAASELLQAAALPHRSGDPRDAVADVVGVVVGAWLARRQGGR